MFHGLQPPCEAGRGPGRNKLMCRQCGVGQYAPARSYCQECPEGGKSFVKHVEIEKLVSRLVLGRLNHSHALHTYDAAGSTPSADRTTCEDCPVLHYSVSGVDECLRCNFPLVLVDNHCASGQRMPFTMPSLG